MAFDLGVPVPPVLLAERISPPAGEERFTCVSLFVHPIQLSWRQVKDHLEAGRPVLSQMVMEALGSSAARGFAFDTWLDQRDHGDHDSNILFGYGGPGEAGFVFLDYAFSMGMTGGQEAWLDGGHLLNREAPFPPMMLQHMDVGQLNNTVKLIEEYPDRELEAIVNRIPDPYFRDGEREPILTGLRERKARLHEFLSHHMKAAQGGAQ